MSLTNPKSTNNYSMYIDTQWYSVMAWHKCVISKDTGLQFYTVNPHTIPINACLLDQINQMKKLYVSCIK